MNLLAVLREASMPIHKKIDRLGISNRLRENNLDASSYLNWLIKTYEFNLGYKTLLDQSNTLDKDLLSLSPSDLGLSQIEEDIRILDGKIELIKPLQLPDLPQPQMAIVPIYTFLGSLMGTGIIYAHIQKHHNHFPTTYLATILEHKSQFFRFKSYLEKMEFDASLHDLKTYTTQFWNAIYNNYIQD